MMAVLENSYNRKVLDVLDGHVLPCNLKMGQISCLSTSQRKVIESKRVIPGGHVKDIYTMESTNHPFRKEHDLSNLHDYVPVPC